MCGRQFRKPPLPFVILSEAQRSGRISRYSAMRTIVRSLASLGMTNLSMQFSRVALNRRFSDSLRMPRPPRQRLLEDHVARLIQCRRCPRMLPPPISGGAIVSKVMLIGQAPGVREPVLKRPFAHTAGRTLFRWFEHFCEMNETAI